MEEHDQKSKRAEIKVNRALMKTINGEKGKLYLEKINLFDRYPVIQGAIVHYIEGKNRPLLTRIDFPNEIRLCGIIQIDKKGQFYFISRN